MRTTIKKAINRRIRKIVASRFSIEQHEARLLNRKSGFVSRRTSNESIHYLLKELYPVHGEGMELVRLGPKGDGGYLVPNDFEGIEACFSPGVSQVSGFEKDCANLGMKIFMADKSVNKPAEQHELFSFTKKYIGSFGNEDFITMDDWGNGSITNRHSNLLLQMDIESAEYESLLNMSDQLLNRFRLIVIEFHQLDQFGNLPFFNITSNAFRKILKSHRCVHIHPNNFHATVREGDLEIPPLAEFTFLRKDRIRNPFFATNFPHPLDHDNTAKPSFPLPQCWYSKESD